jgi:hypothetical protein
MAGSCAVDAPLAITMEPAIVCVMVRSIALLDMLHATPLPVSTS